MVDTKVKSLLHHRTLTAGYDGNTRLSHTIVTIVASNTILNTTYTLKMCALKSWRDDGRRMPRKEKVTCAWGEAWCV